MKLINSSLCLIALQLALGTGCSLNAEIMGTDSVEWLTCSSSVVVVAKVQSVASFNGPGDVVYDDCTLEVVEAIKGTAAKELEFTYRNVGRGETAWKTVNEELLIFLSVWKDHYTDEQARLLTDPYHETRMHKRLVPTRDYRPFSIILLSDLPKLLFDKEMQPVAGREPLLALCRQWSKSAIKHSIQEDAPWDSAVFKALYVGSSVFLNVPAEEKYNQRFLKFAKSSDAGERSTAASELCKFPGAESEAALEALLADKTENIWSYANDSMDRIEFGIRSAAYRSLQQLGKPVPKLELQREPTLEERRKYRHDAWQRSFKEALKDGWIVAAIRDGEIRTKESRDWTVVEVDLVNAQEQCKLWLIPKEFGRDNTKGGIYIGINGPDSQGGRHFYAEKGIPELLKTRLVSYFGLVVQK